MPGKGSEAKSQVAMRMQKAFGEDFIGVFDKKIYVWATEDGERIQVCLTPTCPKTFIEPIPAPSAISSPGSEVSKDITPEERTTIEQLMERLGI